MDKSVIECILTHSKISKKGTIKQSRSRHLQLGDKLPMIYLPDNGVGPTELCSEFKISRRIIFRLKADTEKLISIDKNRVNVIVQRHIHDKHPVIEQRATDLFNSLTNNDFWSQKQFCRKGPAQSFVTCDWSLLKHQIIDF